MSGLAGQAMRFAVVGAAASATHVAVGLGLAQGAGWRPWTANVVAFFVALGVSYLGNAKLTFGVQAAQRRALARFAALSFAAFAYNQAVVATMTGAGTPYAAALAVVVLTAPPLTFVLSRGWAFSASRPQVSPTM